MSAKGKATWRKRIGRHLARMNLARRRRAEAMIRTRLARLLHGNLFKRIFAFAAAYPEPNLWPLYRSLFKSGRAVSFPRVVGRGLTFYFVTSMNRFHRGAFGILEPGRGRRVGRSRFGDLILVPAVGVSERGGRLGRGGGYYDRWLRRNTDGFRIAVLFHSQLVRHLPRTRRDEDVDAAVTERGIFVFKKGG